MGLTKQYLRYVPSAVFGVVGTTTANVVFTSDHQFAAVAAVEHVFIWDLRKGEKVLTLEGSKYEVTALARSENRPVVAVGYADGSIKLFSTEDGEVMVTFNGHKTAVSTLHFDSLALRLASGSKDTDLIIWDVVNESGLYRLKGHRGMVTKVAFMSQHNIVISSSKDTFVKFWDLDTQHCFKTLVGHRSEVWDFAILPEDRGLVTGTSGSDLQAWDITFKDEVSFQRIKSTGPSPAKKSRKHFSDDDGDDAEGDDEGDDDDEEEMGDDDSILSCTKAGTILRKGTDRVVSLQADSTGRILGCHGPSAVLELFKVCNEEELEKRLQKKVKRLRKRARAAEGDDAEVDVSSVSLTAEERIRPLTTIKMSSKIRSFHSLVDTSEEVKLVALLHNNSLETHHLSLAVDTPTASKGTGVSQPGHRHDVRTLTFSSDSTAVLSAGGNSVKIWNRSTLRCIRTMKCGYAVSSIFAPGDRHCIVGTKTGHLELFDIASGTMIDSFEAHEGTVWSICLSPDKRGFVTGSADKTLKFWEFELVSLENEDGQTSRQLSFVHTRTLKMSDDVLCVKYSPDHRLIAASLLDSTVKVFFADTLKFFLSLYGHKLPVLTMDISSDSTLIVTGSADKNVKIWGLDFGDCHKSMFAHEDSVMCVQFLPDTHLFFTGGKDNRLKQWDADHFQQITTLEGHHGEVWCMAISPDGDFVVSGSHDKSLRLWEKTEEPLVLEEEQEMEREKRFEESVEQEEQPIAGEATGGEVSMPEKRTVETLRGAERLMEALNLYQEETAKMDDHAQRCKASNKQLPLPDKHPILQAYGNLTPLKYVGEVLKKIKSSELEESLLVLPLDYALRLLPLLERLVDDSWEVELACRCLLFLLRVHHGQITSSQSLLPMIDRLRSTTLDKVNELKDTIGFNMAAFQFLKAKMEAESRVQLFSDASEGLRQRRKKQKKRQQRALLKL
ncbi:WD repeat-containing protein 3-like [Diadema antillarum]|uniref:WD repeat-containing protein 3-like n=1 Tax=Diadema antillarum TaxID=105358 RepID=UPI003A87EC29